MSDGNDVLDGLTEVASALRTESRRLEGTAEALHLSGNEALAKRLRATAERLQGLSVNTNQIASAYVQEAMNAATASQRSVDKFVLAVLEKEIDLNG